MELVKVTLYNKMGGTEQTFDTIAQWSKPSIIAQNYYQVNQNIHLKAVVTLHTDADTIDKFDSILVKGKKMRILAKSEPSRGTQKLEVGV